MAAPWQRDGRRKESGPHGGLTGGSDHALRGAAARASIGPIGAGRPRGHRHAGPFALRVASGLNFQPEPVPGEPFTFVSPNRSIYGIVGGAKGPAVIGHATISLWNQTVPAAPDPFLGPLRPLAGLGVFEFGPPLDLVAHFGLIDAPDGARTTIGLFDTSSHGLDAGARGTWLAGPAKGSPGAEPPTWSSRARWWSGRPHRCFLSIGVTPPHSSASTPAGLTCELGEGTGSFPASDPRRSSGSGRASGPALPAREVRHAPSTEGRIAWALGRLLADTRAASTATGTVATAGATRAGDEPTRPPAARDGRRRAGLARGGPPGLASFPFHRGPR